MKRHKFNIFSVDTTEKTKTFAAICKRQPNLINTKFNNYQANGPYHNKWTNLEMMTCSLTLKLTI